MDEFNIWGFYCWLFIYGFVGIDGFGILFIIMLILLVMFEIL